MTPPRAVFSHDLVVRFTSPHGMDMGLGWVECMIDKDEIDHFPDQVEGILDAVRPYLISLLNTRIVP